MEYKTIEIDIDIYRTIEANRLNFSESANDILHRILNTGQQAALPLQPQPIENGWEAKGVFFPEGSYFKMEYNNQKYYGQIKNGNLVVQNKKFRSFSDAANYFARSKNGKMVNINGWNVFSTKFPGESTWQQVNKLRK